MNKPYTESLIAKICTQPRTLDYIVQHLDGVDPMAAHEFLKELENDDVIRCENGLWQLEHAAQKNINDILSLDNQGYLQKYMGDFDIFKKPHPRDFEWRNSPKSVAYLSSLLIELNDIHDNVLILGMPTLFASLCKRDIPQKVTIVERNKGVIETLKELSHKNCKVIEADVFKVDPSKVGMYSTVIMDPPWYTPHFFQFIWLASRCLKLGGRLIISIPPLNTRPNVDLERIAWFSFCQEQGLGLENLYSRKLEYTMPFFEWNAIRKADSEISPFWRRGDLAMFKRLNITHINRPECEEGEDLWREVEIKGVRIRINVERIDCSDKLKVDEIVSGQILPSISKRDPRRQLANVWTSGNRIFHVNDPVKFYNHLQNYKDGINDRTEDFAYSFEFITLISGFENEEYNNYLEWLYHQMERETD